MLDLHARQRKVIVIGAGPAGLTAARDLAGVQVMWDILFGDHFLRRLACGIVPLPWLYYLHGGLSVLIGLSARLWERATGQQLVRYPCQRASAQLV